MLRFEKGSSAQKISLVVREKDPFFSAALQKALLIAFSLHLAFFLLVKITLHRSDGMFISLPSEVVSDGFSGTSNAVALPPEDPLFNGFDLMALGTLPSLNRLPDEVDRDGDGDKPYYDENPFFPLEQELLFSSYDPMEREATSLVAKVVLSGPLAKFGPPGLEQTLILGLKELPFKPMRAIYDVEISAEEGCVIWLFPKELSSDPSFNALAERFIYGLCFPRNAASFNIQGTVELHLKEVY